MAEDAAVVMRLLYVDHDEEACRLVEEALARRGCKVEIVHTAAQGMARAKAEAFDVIGIEHGMTKQPGSGVLQALRALDPAPQVIYVGDTNDNQIAVAALSEGAIASVVKDGDVSFITLFMDALQRAEQNMRLRQERDAAIVALQASNTRLEDTIAHQSALLREMNHRVANSLQLVSSLIHMQSSALPEGPGRDALRDTQTRIDAIVQIHRRLYTSGDMKFVDVHDYLSGLTSELAQSFAAEECVKLRLEAAPFRLPTDLAVSLGVIVVELVTNACKYAYPNGVCGEVRILFTNEGGGVCQLVVEDDGQGFPPDQPLKGTGLGELVISAMAKTLGAEVGYDSSHKGVRAILRFEVPETD